MSDNNSNQLAETIANGIARNQHDQAVGALILLSPIGLLIPQTAFIGIPLLLLFIFTRPRIK